MRTATIASLAVFLSVLSVQAQVGRQQPPTPPPGQVRPGPPPLPAADEAAEPTKGTARIAGRVVSQDGQPIRGATVTVSVENTPQSWTARADEGGRYEVTGLPARVVTARASRTGFAGVSFGASTPSGRARPIPLRDGQALNGIDFVLPRTCAIVGQVVDEHGGPAGGASIDALLSAMVGGQRRLLSLGLVSTSSKPVDDLGRFRVFNLAPRTYFLRAVYRPIPDSLVSDDPDVYPPTFLPGTVVLSEATPVVCRAGEETTGVVVSLIRVRTATVSGLVVDESGRPASTGSVALAPPEDLGFATRISASVRPDGTFSLPNVVPRAYTLMGDTGLALTPRQSATMPLTVAGGDVAGLTLQLSSGTRASGRVVAEDGTTIDFPLTRLTIGTAMSADIDGPIGGSRASVRADGAFTMAGLQGSKRLTVSGLPDGWQLKSMRIGPQEVTHQPLTFKAGVAVEDLEVVITSRVTRLAGTVTDGMDRPASQCTVGVFAEDADRWWLLSPYEQTTVAKADGQFEITRLPPGRYLAIALPDIDGDEWLDTEYRERLRTLATPVTIDEGQAVKIALRLVTSVQ